MNESVLIDYPISDESNSSEPSRKRQRHSPISTMAKNAAEAQIDENSIDSITDQSQLRRSTRSMKKKKI